MTEIICGRCGAKFQSETEQDSDEYCKQCLTEMEGEQAQIQIEYLNQQEQAQAEAEEEARQEAEAEALAEQCGEYW
jgi:DNA-directed RNA polymerase subunit RPC12/RpoP